MIQALVFDLDGVIADSETLHWKAFNHILGKQGYSLDYPTYLDQYIGFNDRRFFKTYFARQGLFFDDRELTQLIQDKARAFEIIASDGMRPIPGAIPLINNAVRFWPLAICSGAVRQDIELTLAALDGGAIRSQFEAIVSADDVHQSKPDPTCYRVAAERLGIEPEHCLAIEDNPAGLVSARKAGMKTIALTTTCPAENLSDADHIVDNLLNVTVDQIRQWYVTEKMSMSTYSRSWGKPSLSAGALGAGSRRSPPWCSIFSRQLR